MYVDSIVSRLLYMYVCKLDYNVYMYVCMYVCMYVDTIVSRLQCLYVDTIVSR